jgi:phenylacetate-CoA ligase
MRVMDGVRLLGMTARLVRSQWHSRDRILAYQRERLIAQLTHAVVNVPFYGQFGIASSSLRSAEDLHRFPVITKADVQSRPEAFLARTFDGARLFRSHSSGATGEPTVTCFDVDAWLFTKHALKARRVLADTRALRQRVLIFSEDDAGRDSTDMWSMFKPLLRVQQLSLGEPIEANARALVAFRPTILYGFPAYLLELAKAVHDTGAQVPRVPLVYTSSEVLSEPARLALVSAYGGRIVDVYGSTEFKEIAVQCRFGRYHINFESVFVESVAPGAGAAPRLLVTSLVNKAMPLVRYELGDTGRLVDEECPCGRKSPQIMDLYGRVSEMLAFPDGTRVYPYALMTAIEQQAGVRHFRIVHEEPARVRVETFAEPRLSRAESAALEARLRRLVPTDVSLRLVELADRGTHAKRRAVSREF